MGHLQPELSETMKDAKQQRSKKTEKLLSKGYNVIGWVSFTFESSIFW